jgi:hypothetical protein
VPLGACGVEEDACRLDHNVYAHITPLEACGVRLGGRADFLPVDNENTILDRNVALEASVNGVVLQHVGEVVDVEQIVDRHNLNVFALCCGTENHASNATETVNANLDHLDCFPSFFAGGELSPRFWGVELRGLKGASA